jgi:hypothetical protein
LNFIVTKPVDSAKLEEILAMFDIKRIDWYRFNYYW